MSQVNITSSWKPSLANTPIQVPLAVVKVTILPIRVVVTPYL